MEITIEAIQSPKTQSPKRQSSEILTMVKIFRIWTVHTETTFRLLEYRRPQAHLYMDLTDVPLMGTGNCECFSCDSLSRVDICIKLLLISRQAQTDVVEATNLLKQQEHNDSVLDGEDADAANQIFKPQQLSRCKRKSLCPK